MAQITLKCYNCGETVIVSKGAHIGICSRCMAEIPVPEHMDTVGEALSHANQLLSESRFEEARDAYGEVLIRAPLEAAACWGYAVSEYGIEFVQDPDTAEMLPTLHRLSQERFSEYLYVKKAIEYAPDYSSQQFYQQQSKQIDEIQSRSLEISGKEDPYDVFICYKQTETGAKRTADSRLAADLYKELIRRGYKTFFAEVTLKPGEEYEPRIFAALNSAKVLLAIGSRIEYYEAVWVKNEWSRYADMLEAEQAAGDNSRMLIPVYSNMDHEELPEALRNMPWSVDMSGHNPKQELFNLVASHFSAKPTEDVSDLIRQVRGQISSAPKMEVSVDNLLTRGGIELVNQNYSKAEQMFQQALDEEPSVEAYLGMMMCQLRIPGREALSQYDKDITEHPMLMAAFNIASPEEEEAIAMICKTCLDNAAWSATCAKKHKECAQETQRVMEQINAFMLDTPASLTMRDARRFIDSAQNAQKSAANESKMLSTTRLFIYLGNLFPAICVVINNLLELAGLTSTVQWVSMPGMIALIVFYFLFFFRILRKIPILEDGIIAAIVRVFFGYGAGMSMSSLLGFSLESSLGYLLVSAVASALFFLIYDRKRLAIKRKAKSSCTEATVWTERMISAQGEVIEQSTEVLLEMVGDYRRYYRPNEWKDAEKQWSGKVRKSVEENVTAMRRQLEQIEKGTVE